MQNHGAGKKLVSSKEEGGIEEFNFSLYFLFFIFGLFIQCWNLRKNDLRQKSSN